MELLNKEHFEKLDNCPLENTNGEINLFRWVNTNDIENSYTPFGFKEKFKNNCLAWGLSTYNSYNSAIETLNNLPNSTREKYNAISSCLIKNTDGIKHQSGKNKNHYTFYPIKGFDLSNNFEVIKEDEQ